MTDVYIKNFFHKFLPLLSLSKKIVGLKVKELMKGIIVDPEWVVLVVKMAMGGLVVVEYQSG